MVRSAVRRQRPGIGLLLRLRRMRRGFGGGRLVLGLGYGAIGCQQDARRPPERFPAAGEDGVEARPEHGRIIAEQG